MANSQDVLRRSERHMSQQEKTNSTNSASPFDTAFVHPGQTVAEKMTSMEQFMENEYVEENTKQKSSTKSKIKPDKLEHKLDQISQVLDEINKKISSNEVKHQEHEKLCEKFTNALFHDNDGLEPRFQMLCDQVNDLTSDLTESKASILTLQTDMDKLRLKHQKEVQILQGTIEKQQNQILGLQYKTAGFTARSMEQNLTFAGIKESATENCKGKIIKFAAEKLDVKILPQEIFSASRMGVANPLAAKPRTILAKVSTSVKDKILANVSKLKGQKDFFVAQQIPDMLVADKRANNYLAKMVKDRNETLPKEEHQKLEIKDKVAYIDEEPVQDWVQVPTVSSMMTTEQEDAEIQLLNFTESQIKTDNKSEFAGFAIKVDSLEEIELAYKAIKLKKPNADHVMMAYNVDKYDGFKDDGEYNAGVKLHMELVRKDIKNVAVFVTRIYGGAHLGARRFQHIVQVAQEALALI